MRNVTDELHTMSEFDGKVLPLMADVLLVDEKRAALPIAIALRPLRVVVAHTSAEAREVLRTQRFRTVMVGLRNAQLSLDNKLRLTPPTAFSSRKRPFTLQKPFGQEALAIALEECWNEPVLLQRMGQNPHQMMMGKQTLRVGPRSLAIAQVQTHWGWTDQQAQVFRHYLDAHHPAEIAKQLGTTEASVFSHLSRGTAKARKVLGIEMKPGELRIWLLQRVMDAD